MTTDRPYRSALPVEEAINELRVHRGTQFDPRVVETFLAVLDSPEAQAATEEEEELDLLPGIMEIQRAHAGASRS